MGNVSQDSLPVSRDMNTGPPVGGARVTYVPCAVVPTQSVVAFPSVAAVSIHPFHCGSHVEKSRLAQFPQSVTTSTAVRNCVGSLL